MNKTIVKNFDVQSVGINADPKLVFDFIADPTNIPLWAKGFSQVEGNRALLETPMGKLPIKLDIRTSAEQGTIDTAMTMPDGSIGKAFSRVTENDNGKSAIFSFVLMAPPVPLAQVEGELAAQKIQLAEELLILKELLEN